MLKNQDTVETSLAIASPPLLILLCYVRSWSFELPPAITCRSVRSASLQQNVPRIHGVPREAYPAPRLEAVTSPPGGTRQSWSPVTGRAGEAFNEDEVQETGDGGPPQHGSSRLWLTQPKYKLERATVRVHHHPRKRLQPSSVSKKKYRPERKKKKEEKS